jgi:hypothetical protein
VLKDWGTTWEPCGLSDVVNKMNLAVAQEGIRAICDKLEFSSCVVGKMDLDRTNTTNTTNTTSDAWKVIAPHMKMTQANSAAGASVWGDAQKRLVLVANASATFNTSDDTISVVVTF